VNHKLPDGWKLTRLDEIIKIQAGYAFDSKLFNKEKGIQLIRIRDLKNGKSTETLYDGNYNKEYIVNTGDYLIGMDGEFRCYQWKGNQALLNQRVCRLLKYSEYVLLPYIYYGINEHLSFIEQKTPFSTVKHISTNQIKNIQIPLPPLKIQKQIAHILDKADELREKRKEANKMLDEFLQSVFLDMFGDPVTNKQKNKFSDYVIINPKKSELIGINQNIEVSFIPMEDVSENGKINNTKYKKLFEVYKNFTYFRNKDVLFAKITPCMENGKGCIASKLRNDIGFGSTEFHVFRPKEKINSEWLFYLLSFKHIRKLAESNMTGSVGQKRVPVGFFERLNVNIPPLDLQNKFAEIVEKVEIQKEKNNQTTKELDNLFQSLLQKAFKGELSFNEEYSYFKNL